jgi:hypothetical protein
LENDDEMRQRYFTIVRGGSSEGIVQAQYYPPESALPVGFIPSDAYVEAVRDKVHDPKKGGTIIPVCDESCPKWDAARHIGGLKRNLITVPQGEEDLQKWIMEGDKRYKELVARSGKVADWDHRQRWRSRQQELRSERNSPNAPQGPSLERFLSKSKAE